MISFKMLSDKFFATRIILQGSIRRKVNFCQCKIRLPTQVYMLVYEDLGYLGRKYEEFMLVLYVKCSVQAYRSWTGIQESSRLYFTICTLACTTCCFRSSTVSSRWLQLVATPVKYNHNSIENISTLS